MLRRLITEEDILNAISGMKNQVEIMHEAKLVIAEYRKENEISESIIVDLDKLYPWDWWRIAGHYDRCKEW